MSDPFLVHGPAIISFSGGRTSAYMLHRILAAHGGSLPDDVVVCFANTGKEMDATLDFVRDCATHWGVPIVWLEYVAHPDPQQRWHRVTYDTAARNGQPFATLIYHKKLLPGPTARFCTIELKVRPMKLYAQQSLGWDHWTNILGLRADEQHRVARMANGAAREVWDNDAPLHRAGITKEDVAAFWERQNFDLNLPNIGGHTRHGNCDLCFLKGAGTISAIMREMPERAAWWIEQEDRVKSIAYGNGKRFRSDRPGYAEMFKAVQNQHAFDFGDLDALNDCICGA